MMLDFPIEKIALKIKSVGTSGVYVWLNGKEIKFQDVLSVDKEYLSDDNHIVLKHHKADPGDEQSYTEVEYFKINDQDFTDEFKKIEFSVDEKNHKVTNSTLPNNCYFGYTGVLDMRITQTTDKLKRAAWLLANDHFQTIKENVRGYAPREKTFRQVYDDARTMFNGCVAPVIKEIDDFVGEIKIKDVKDYIDFQKARADIERWIGESKRLKLSNLELFDNFTYGAGNVNFLESFLNRTDEVYLADKYYYYLGEVTRQKQIKFKNFFDGIEENSRVLVEFPNPWHSNEEMLEIINEARDKNCYIAVDLIWCPASTRNIDIDLSMFDEVYFSMNKAWPLQHIRPAWRWSKEKIHDSSTFQHDWNYVQKPQPNIFLKCIERFSLDHTYEFWKNDCDKIRKVFDLRETEVMWFTLKDGFNYEEFKKHTSEHYSIGDFVCIRKLLDHKDEYFW